MTARAASLRHTLSYLLLVTNPYLGGVFPKRGSVAAMLGLVSSLQCALLRRNEPSEQRSVVPSTPAHIPEPHAEPRLALHVDTGPVSTLHDMFASDMGSSDWHVLAIDGTLSEERELALEQRFASLTARHSQRSNVKDEEETPTQLLSKAFFEACARENFSFESEVDDGNVGNGTIDMGLSLAPIEWGAPDSLLQCPPHRPRAYCRSTQSCIVGTQPCKKARLTALFVIEAINRDRQTVPTAKSEYSQLPPKAGFVLAAHDRNVQLLIEGGIDAAEVARLLNMHVAWYSADQKYLNPEAPVCTHLLPTPYETDYAGVIIVDEGVLDHGGNVYWERDFADIADSALPPQPQQQPTPTKYRTCACAHVLSSAHRFAHTTHTYCCAHPSLPTLPWQTKTISSSLGRCRLWTLAFQSSFTAGLSTRKLSRTEHAPRSTEWA